MERALFLGWVWRRFCALDRHRNDYGLKGETSRERIPTFDPKKVPQTAPSFTTDYDLRAPAVAYFA